MQMLSNDVRGGFSIGSFNILHFQSERFKNEDEKEYKLEKAEHIAKIIKDEGFAITCLQECLHLPFGHGSADCIVRFLNGGMPIGQYDYVHCSTMYDRLKSYGYKYRSDHESGGEYAFIWDRSRVSMPTDKGAMVVYNAINESVAKGLGDYIAGVSAAIASGAYALARKSDAANDKKRAERERAARFAAGTIAGAGAIQRAAVEMRCESRRKAIEELLHAFVRPPFVGIFNLNNDRNKQLRIINTHLQWSKIKGEGITGTAGRKIELAALADVVLTVVNSRRRGFFETVFTVVAGDFNYGASTVTSELLKTSRGSDLTVAQCGSSKPFMVNRVQVEMRKEYPRFEPIPGNDYDHFLFSRPCWSADSAKVVTENDAFFIYSGYSKKTISDHYPVKLTTFSL